MKILLIVSMVMLGLLIALAYHRAKSKKQKDSPLRQKALLSADEQIVFTRLKEILPQAQVMAQVSFDAILTTKYLHTRRKYQKMVADFVIVDRSYRVIAVVALDDVNLLKRSKSAAYQDAVLTTAGYRVLRYVGVPEYDRLQSDFLTDMLHEHQDEAVMDSALSSAAEYSNRLGKNRIFG